MSASLTLPMRACLFYNRLFRFRAKYDWLIRDRMAAEARRKENSQSEDLRYAALEYDKTPAFFAKFPGESVAGRRLLDFGCRFGGASLWFADQGAREVIGVDVAESMLETARLFVRRRTEGRQTAPIDFRRGGSDSIPVDDQSIDRILSEDVVEHLSDPAAIFREWRRVLVPGGKVLLSFGPLWYHPHGVHLWEIFPAPWTHVLFSERTCVRTRNYLKDDGGAAERWQDMNKMTLRWFKRLVRQSGFRVELLRTHAVWKLRPLLLVPGLREFFVSQVDCVLVKDSAQPDRR